MTYDSYFYAAKSQLKKNITLANSSVKYVNAEKVCDDGIWLLIKTDIGYLTVESSFHSIFFLEDDGFKLSAAARELYSAAIINSNQDVAQLVDTFRRIVKKKPQRRSEEYDTIVSEYKKIAKSNKLDCPSGVLIYVTDYKPKSKNEQSFPEIYSEFFDGLYVIKIYEHINKEKIKYMIAHEFAHMILHKMGQKDYKHGILFKKTCETLGFPINVEIDRG